MITLIAENDYGQSPSQSDLMYWANQYNITHPVVADPGFNEIAPYLFANPNFTGTINLPNMQLLKPQRIVYTTNDWVTNSDILQVLP